MKLHKPVEVTLTQEEAQRSYQFCLSLQKDKQKHKVVDLWYDQNNSSFGVNVMGHLGEVAVSKVLGTPVDYEIRTHGDEGWDTVLDGRTVQIKTSTQESLIFNSKAAFKADIAILVVYLGEDRANSHIDPRFKVVGWVTREDFFQYHYKHDFGHGVRMVMDSFALQTLDEIAVAVA